MRRFRSLALCVVVAAAAACGPPRRVPVSPTAQSADPTRTLSPHPDYTKICTTGLDSSVSCLDAVVAAVDTARAAEGVKPMTLPSDFGRLPVAQQLLVAINLERVDRGLRPFAGLTAALDGNAQRGADMADDPPDPGRAYRIVESEWAGGAANGLDAVYGWMYDDGPGGTNLDCPAKGGGGCWAHRHGLLEDFGPAGTLVMGAAVDPVGDTTPDDPGGTSMAATLAVTASPGPLISATG